MNTQELLRIVKKGIGYGYDLINPQGESWKVRIVRDGRPVGAVTLDGQIAYIVEGSRFVPNRDRRHFEQVADEIKSRGMRVVYFGPYFSP